MVRHLRAVPNGPDKQVLDALHHLVREAQAGRITGIAYVTLEPGMDFSANVVGTARSSPILTLGIASALKEAVSKLVGPL